MTKKGGERIWVPDPYSLSHVLRQALTPETRIVYRIVVDHSLTLLEMIRNAKFDRDTIRASSKKKEDELGVIPRDGTTELDIELLDFGRYRDRQFGGASCDLRDIVAEIHKTGYRPAKVEELLALAEKHKEVEFKRGVVAVGSSFCECIPVELGCGAWSDFFPVYEISYKKVDSRGAKQVRIREITSVNVTSLMQYIKGYTFAVVRESF